MMESKPLNVVRTAMCGKTARILPGNHDTSTRQARAYIAFLRIHRKVTQRFIEILTEYSLSYHPYIETKLYEFSKVSEADTLIVRGHF